MDRSVPPRCLWFSSGRMMGVRTYGDPAGMPVLCLHGTPGSNAQFAIADETARRMRLTLIAPDRWGYGLTDAPPMPTLASFAGEMEMLMDRVDAERFAVVGISGGAPYAAAVAARLARRVTTLALVSPLGPLADARLVASLRFRHRLRFAVLAQRPRTVSAAMRVLRWGTLRIPRTAGRIMALRARQADRQLIRQPAIVQAILRSVREGLRPGTLGPKIDLALFSRPWLVDLSAITAPCRVWMGTSDATVPLPAVRLLVDRIPRCVLTELPGQGHFWVSLHYAEVLTWIMSAIGGGADEPAHGI